MSSRPRSKKPTSSDRHRADRDRDRDRDRERDRERERERERDRPSTRQTSSRYRMDDRPRTTAAGPAAMVSNEYRPMQRPGFGVAGKKIRLETNFFEMRIPRGLKVSQYAIHIYRLKHPMDDDKRKRKNRERASSSSDARVWTDVSGSEPIFFNRGVFGLVCRRYGRDFGCSLAYDGRSIAYAAREVNRECLGHMYKVTVNREGNPASDQEVRDGKSEEVRVKIEHTKYLEFDSVLRGRVHTIASAEYLAALDVVLGTTPVGKYVQIGRSFYSPDYAKELGRRNVTASAWRGFYQSARLSQKGLIVNLDESFTAFWNRGGKPLVELIRDANDGRDLQLNDNRQLREVAQRLKALKVKAVHTGITYRVHGFSNKPAHQIMFDSATEGRKVSIAEYFYSTYNIRLRQKDLPCVRTNPKRETFLPMELLVVLENQRLVGTLGPDQTKEIVKIASSKPHERRAAALKTMQKLNHSADSVCRDFGVQVDSRLISVDARVLPAPIIQYKNGNVRVQSGVWKPHREQFAAGGMLYTWAVVNMSNLRNDDVGQFVNDLVRAGRRSGMTIAEARPRMFKARNDRIGDELRDIARNYRKNTNWCIERYPLQLILIIKDRQDAPTYNLIKKIGDLELGIATQVCLQKHCGRGAKGRDMYCDNVMLKINSKLGGQNSVVGAFGLDPSSRIKDVPFLNIPHIVLGADVTHPMAGGKSPSVAALVGSRDRQGVQYTGAIRNQTGRKEVIVDIGEMFKEVYARWYVNFKKSVHVQAIIMFRDGVSDGQFEEVMEVEIEALRRACRDISSNFRPKITYIIVTKRHHARFFAEQRDQDKSGNIMPGTVIDSGITSRDFYDFYLNSHAGIQGTSKPSKYTVLLDENKIPVDVMQGYIYRLSHGFVRCNRSVSMVNSAYYAHLLAFRGRAYLGEDMSDTASTASTESVPRAPHLHEYLSRRLFFV